MNKEELLKYIEKYKVTTGYNIILKINNQSGPYMHVFCKESTLSYLVHSTYRTLFDNDSREAYTYLKNDSLALIRQFWKELELPSFGKHIWKINDDYSIVRINFSGPVFKYALYMDLFLTLNSITRYDYINIPIATSMNDRIKNIMDDSSSYSNFNNMIEAIRSKTKNEREAVTIDRIYRETNYNGYIISGSMSSFSSKLLFS